MSDRFQAAVRSAAIGLAGALLLVACGSITPTPSVLPGTGATTVPTPGSSAVVIVSPTPSAAPTPTSTPDPTPTPEPTPELVPAPLTGRLVSPAAARRHPIAVMIDDLSAARPQSGFSAASIVWQAPAEGGIPRYMMIFGETRPGAVGPVRSSRYYYIAWAAEWDAVYAHSGGSPQALATLRAKGNGQLVYNADEFAYGAYFHRVTTKFPPHNLYTDGTQLDRIAKRVGASNRPPKPIWRFAPDARPAERPVGGRIEVSYRTSTIRYDYDRRTNSYPRTVSVEGAQRDETTKQRIAPKNVVIMLMRFGPLNDGHPQKRLLEAQVIGSGVAWISTNGRTIKGTWRKASLSGPTKFYDRRGREVTLTVGQTFINVMPTGTIVKIRAGAPPPIDPRFGNGAMLPS